MIRAFLVWFIALYFLVPVAHAEVTVGPAKFPPQLSLDGTFLTLNGAGIRTRVLFRVYAIGLYLPQPASSAEAVLASQPPRLLRVQLLRALSGVAFADALIDGLKKNHSPETLAAFQQSLETLRTAIAAKGEYPENTIVTISESRDGAVRVAVGDQPLVEPIAQKGVLLAPSGHLARTATGARGP